jgi:hypothetical protein
MMEAASTSEKPVNFIPNYKAQQHRFSPCTFMAVLSFGRCSELSLKILLFLCPKIFNIVLRYGLSILTQTDPRNVHYGLTGGLPLHCVEYRGANMQADKFYFYLSFS